jgi:hypothetical protein
MVMVAGIESSAVMATAVTTAVVTTSMTAAVMMMLRVSLLRHEGRDRQCGHTTDETSFPIRNHDRSSFGWSVPALESLQGGPASRPFTTSRPTRGWPSFIFEPTRHGTTPSLTPSE